MVADLLERGNGRVEPAQHRLQEGYGENVVIVAIGRGPPSYAGTRRSRPCPSDRVRALPLCKFLVASEALLSSKPDRGEEEREAIH